MFDPAAKQSISSFVQSRRRAEAGEVGANATRRRTGIRAELVARIRAEIAAGTYLTDEKLEIALDRMRRGLPEAAA